MQKIISLFKRNYDGDRLVRDEVVEGAEWVLAGEGHPTRKLDGTCCLVRGGKLFKRYDAKHGKTPPEGFEPAQEPDPVTGHWPGWLPVGDGPEDKWFRDGWENTKRTMGETWPGDLDQTFELCGPRVNGNPENEPEHVLIRHGWNALDNPYPDQIEAAPTAGSLEKPTFESIKAYLSAHDIEGIVWHHPDGRMVKIKAKDFGIKRGGKLIIDGKTHTAELSGDLTTPLPWRE